MELELIHDFLGNFKAEIDRGELRVEERILVSVSFGQYAYHEIQTLHLGEFEPHMLVNSEDLSKILNENARRGNRPIPIKVIGGIHRPMI